MNILRLKEDMPREQWLRLRKHGIDKLYTEKMSGVKKRRPELDALMERLEVGDTVVIESLSRLGRSTKDLLSLVDIMEEKVISLKENIDTGSSTGKLLLAVLSALAQFERDVIVERGTNDLTIMRRHLVFLLMYVAAEEVYGAGFADDDCRYSLPIGALAISRNMYENII